MLDLDAGKYAAFVWPAYAITALAFLAMVAFTLNASRRWRRRAEKTQR